MANRKKKPPFNSTIMLMGALIILILGAVGVKVPDALQDLFNVQPQTTTPQAHQHLKEIILDPLKMVKPHFQQRN